GGGPGIPECQAQIAEGEVRLGFPAGPVVPVQAGAEAPAERRLVRRDGFFETAEAVEDEPQAEPQLRMLRVALQALAERSLGLQRAVELPHRLAAAGIGFGKEIHVPGRRLDYRLQVRERPVPV